MIVSLLMLAVAFVAYLFIVRPWLKTQTWAVRFFAWIEPIEARLWAKSRTVAVARGGQFATVIITIHDTVALWVTDWTPIMGRLLAQIPDDLRPIAIAVILGAICKVFEWLRWVTTGPVGEG